MIKIIKMITYTQYKQIHNIEGNEFPNFLDITSWKENNQKNCLHITNNSDIPNYIPPTKLKILSQVKKEYAIKVKIFKEGIRYYTIMRYDESKLYLNQKFYTKYTL